jgi:hypothetical protein
MGRLPFVRGDREGFRTRVFKRGETPLPKNLPLSLPGEGDTGGEVDKICRAGAGAGCLHRNTGGEVL